MIMARIKKIIISYSFFRCHDFPFLSLNLGVYTDLPLAFRLWLILLSRIAARVR